MRSIDKKTPSLAFAGLIALSLTVSGCAAVALGAGAAGGYAAAKDMEDGKLIDSRSSGNDVNRGATKVDKTFD
jgi:outer membrane lipoprotein-sorting protein